MTMHRRRVLSLRLSETEYQTLKFQAEQAGISVPVYARSLTLEAIQLTPRLDQLQHLIGNIPDRAGMERLTEKIDRAGNGKARVP